MRRLAVGGGLLAVVGVILGFTFFTGSGEHASGKAALRLVRRAPVTVRGAEFQARERVRLTLNSRRAVQAKTDRGGSFVASFGVPVSRCDKIFVIATGSEGNRVVLKVRQPPACIVMRRP